MDRIKEACARRRPDCDLTVGQISPEYCWYLGASELLQDTRAMVSSIRDRLLHPRRRPRPIAITPQHERRRRTGEWECRWRLSEILKAEDIHVYLKEVAAEADLAQRPDEVEQRLRQLFDRLALLEALGPGETQWASERVAVLIRGLDDNLSRRREIRQSLLRKYSFSAGATDLADGMEFGLETNSFLGDGDNEPGRRNWTEEISQPDRRRLEPTAQRLDVVLFEGPRAREFLAIERGTHVFGTNDGRFVPLQVVALPLDGDDDLGTVLPRCLDDHARCLDAAARRREPPCEDPLAWLPVVAVYLKGHGMVTDFRTGLVARPGGSVAESEALMASLPLPPEFQE